MAPVATSPFPHTMTLPIFKQSFDTASPANPGANPVPSPPPLPKFSARPQEVLNAPVRTEFSFDPIEEALEAFGRGEFLVVADDEGRENEGDLIIAGSEVSTEKLAWMIRYTRCARVPSYKAFTHTSRYAAGTFASHCQPRDWRSSRYR